MADDKVGLHKGYEHWVSPAPINEDWDKDLEFVLIRTLDDLRVHDVEHKFVAWDTETSGLNPEMDWIVGFSFSFDGKTGYYVPVKHDDIALGKEALDIFYSILKKAGTQLLYNCRFDQRFMEYAGYNLEGLPYYDAMNAIWLADTNMVLPSLKASERHYMGWTPKTFSETLGDATTFQHVPAEDAYKYACLVGETEVCMSDKILKKIADIQVGDVVQTMQGNKQVTAVYDNGTHSVCKLAFMDGTVIYATKDHKFLVWINSIQMDWMTVEQIMSSSRQHYIRLVTLNDDGSLDSLCIDLYASTLDAEERHVYDIQVKDVHNFRLANGIISHNCTDAIGTYKIAMISNRYYVENKPASKYDNDMLYPLMRLENTPQRLDTEYLLSLRPQVDETIERTKAEVYRLAGQEFNLNSPQQFGKILVERFAVDTGARTATGSMKADLKTVDAWLTKHSATVAQDVKDFLKAYKEYKKTVKFKSAYLEKYIKAAQEQDKFPVRFSYKVQSVPCLTENNVVLLKNKGIVSIKDVKENDEIWTQYGFKKVLWNNSHEVDSVYRLTLKNGSFIEGTAHHPILLNHGSSKKPKLQWCAIRDVHENEHIVVNHHSVEDWETDVCDPEFARLLGCLDGDGCVCLKDRIKISYFSEESVEMMDYYASLMKRYFGLDAHTEKENGCRCITQCYFSTCVAEKLRSLGVRGDGVPQIVKNASPKVWLYYLAGLFDTDGNVSCAKAEKHKTVLSDFSVRVTCDGCVREYPSLKIACEKEGASEGTVGFILRGDSRYNNPDSKGRLWERIPLFGDKFYTPQVGVKLIKRQTVLDVFHMLSYFGIPSTFREVPSTQQTHHTQYYCRVRTQQGLVLFKSLIGDLMVSKKRVWIDQYPLDTFVEYADTRPVSCELIERKTTVYDIEVEDVHEYVANGIVTHNTGRLSCGADAKNSFFTKNNVQCLEENTEVLTSEGIKPIKDIVTGELVWSGSAFVPCVQLGSKQKRCETIWTYFGKITASLEHKFYTLNLFTFELEWECLGNAISCGKPLVRNTNDGGFTFRELLENEMFKKSMLLKPELSEERINELEEIYEGVRFDMIRKADNFWYPNIIPPEVTVYDLCVPTYERFTANGFIVHNSTPKPHAIMLKGRKATEQEIAEKKDILGWYFSNDIPDEEAKGLVEGMEPGNLNIRRAFLPENDQCYVVSIDMCLEGGSPVQTKRGYMGICEMKPCDEVWSPQGWVPVSRVMRTGVEKVIKVFPDNGGQAIYCTENHPFVINGEKVKAKDIKGKVPSVPFHAYVKESVERNKVIECLSCLKQCKTIKDASHYVLEHDLKPVIEDALETYTRAEVSVWCGILVSSFGHFMNAIGIQPSGKAFRYRQSRFYNNVFAGESTPTSAYLFGFILGDGNISRRRGDYLTLNISSKDEAHLRQICNIFGEDLNIRHNEKKGCEWWTLDIPSRDICNRLLELGISERKSTEPSNVSFEWLGDNFRHFIRGLFDADGYVRITSVLDVSFVGHDSYITEIKKRIDGQWGYKYTPSLSHLSLLGTVEQRKFIYAYLYQEATIWLQRKRDIIESWYQDKFGDLVFPVWNCTVDTTEHQLYVQCANVHQCAEELRIVANLCHEDTWINAFNSGADVHKACYSPDTEFMTERGWLTADKITPDMKIAYYDDKTDSVKFTRADKRCTNDATEVYSREDTFDVTDNHRMYVKCANEESYGIVLAKDLKSKGNPRQRFTMKVSMGNPIDFGYVMKSILDPIFFMSGFVIASKHEIEDDRLHITLGHPCLSMPYSVLSMVDGSNIRTTSLTLTKEATHRLSVNGFLRSSENLLSHVVDNFSQYSGTAKKDFMQQMICGLVYGLASREDSELYIVNGDNIHGRVYIEDKSLADVIQWALTLNGISCQCVYGIHKKKYVLHVKTLRDNAIGMSYHSVKKQNVAGKNLVYSCFTVPSGLLVTRYHGRITVNGNTAIKLFGEENYSKDARKKAKCVAGDTILHTAEGHTIAIRDLVSDETRKNAVIGEPVELPEPKTRISTPEGWSPVTHWISNGKKDTLKLIIERQLTLEVTPDHLVGKYDPDASDDLSKKYRLVRADSLSVGDYVLWDYCPMRITDIQKGSSDVYDITVDNASHTFHANGVVVHNCASFGILYGSGAQGFNNSFPDMTLDECREFMTKFKAALPNITSGQQAYVEHAKIYGCVPTAFGRMRRVRWFLQSGDRAKVAFGERTVKNCYSPDTEFLTKDGWKLAKDILPDTQLAYYVPEKKVIRYTNAGERYTHRCTESVVYHSVSGAWNVTTNHRMWVSKNGNDFESVVADKLCDMDKFTVITSSFMDDENAKHKHDETAFTIDGKSFTFEDMAFLLGVCIRRGVITYENGGGSRDGVLTVTCDASQIPVRDRLKNTFGDLITETKRLQAGKYLKLIRFGVSLRDYVKENIGKTRKAFHVPAWVYDSDTLTVEAFIAGVVGQKMMEHPNDRFTFRTHSQKLADDIQRLCTMCGFFTRLMANKDANGKSAFTMHIQRMNIMIIGNRKRDEYRQRPVHKVTHEEMEYSCFEVPSHILVTRYRGFVSYHMNTTVQGTAADVLKLIFCRLWKKVFKPYPQVKFMSTIHDEVNFSIPIELAREVIPICMECMTINRSDWPVTLKCSLSVSRTDLGSLVPFTYDFEHDTYEPEWDTLDVKPKKKEEPKLVVAVPDETNQDEAEMELHFEFLTDEDMLF